MKHKIAISVGEETLLKVRECIRKKQFSNRSQAFEACFNRAVENERD
jgi:metal-responsive CopG/Arc/MetJ family transcriptional regulator